MGQSLRPAAILHAGRTKLNNHATSIDFSHNIHSCSNMTRSFASNVFLVAILVLRTVSANLYHDGCTVSDYYSELWSNTNGISEWNRTDIGNLLQDTHRKVLPYTHSTKEDVWDALIDLDAGSTPGTVKLIYKNTEVAATPYGTSGYWNREHLWPKSHGVDTTGPDMTDIHHLRPADWVSEEKTWSCIPSCITSNSFSFLSCRT